MEPMDRDEYLRLRAEYNVGGAQAVARFDYLVGLAALVGLVLSALVGSGLPLLWALCFVCVVVSELTSEEAHRQANRDLDQMYRGDVLPVRNSTWSRATLILNWAAAILLSVGFALLIIDLG